MSALAASPARWETSLADVVQSFVSSKQANQDQLAFVNGAGNAIMKVDNSSKLNPGDKRNTVRISTSDRFTVGSLWIADILHIPYGVSRPALVVPERVR